MPIGNCYTTAPEATVTSSSVIRCRTWQLVGIHL